MIISSANERGRRQRRRTERNNGPAVLRRAVGAVSAVQCSARQGSPAGGVGGEGELV